jgi:hypothetical protein
VVNWTQTVILNGTQEVPSILVELPADAQNIQVEMEDGNGNYTDITAGVTEFTESDMESVGNYTQHEMSFTEMAKMLNATDLVSLDMVKNDLDEIKQEGKPTKALLIDDKYKQEKKQTDKTQSSNAAHGKVKKFNHNEKISSSIDTTNNRTVFQSQNIENATEFKIKFTTPAPNATVNNYSTETKFNKTVTVSHESTLHYTNVTSYTDIPEELVIHNMPIKLHWLINNTKVDVTNDLRFQVTFVDSDGNGINDRMQWIVPQLSEQEFEVEAEITIINVQSRPIVGGNWTVYFDTTGTADLTIKGIDGILIPPVKLILPSKELMEQHLVMDYQMI